eukprot:GHVS01007379.1.p1 GENE.GHVS01007379.1~~GHVS01007379.1.p1  ORF type:complete len:173 (-),score=44.55 GHVS01007379.1:215-733(-)
MVSKSSSSKREDDEFADCLSEDGEENSDNNTPSVVSIFDLDDTLIPTDWIRSAYADRKHHGRVGWGSYCTIREELDSRTNGSLVPLICSILRKAIRRTQHHKGGGRAARVAAAQRQPHQIQLAPPVETAVLVHVGGKLAVSADWQSEQQLRQLWQEQERPTPSEQQQQRVMR